MLQSIIHFFSPAPPIPAITDTKTINKSYKKFRYSVFFSATFGYALFYVCRLSISVAKKPLVDAHIFTESELGKICAALFFTYAVGKLINGFFADRTYTLV